MKKKRKLAQEKAKAASKPSSEPVSGDEDTDHIIMNPKLNISQPEVPQPQFVILQNLVKTSEKTFTLAKVKKTSGKEYNFNSMEFVFKHKSLLIQKESL